MKNIFFLIIIFTFIACGEPSMNTEHKRKICKTLYDIIQEQQVHKFDSIRLRAATDSVIKANGYTKDNFKEEMKTFISNRDDLKSVFDSVSKMQDK